MQLTVKNGKKMDVEIGYSSTRISCSTCPLRKTEDKKSYCYGLSREPITCKLSSKLTRCPAMIAAEDNFLCCVCHKEPLEETKRINRTIVLCKKGHEDKKKEAEKNGIEYTIPTRAEILSALGLKYPVIAQYKGVRITDMGQGKTYCPKCFLKTFWGK